MVLRKGRPRGERRESRAREEAGGRVESEWRKPVGEWEATGHGREGGGSPTGGREGSVAVGWESRKCGSWVKEGHKGEKGGVEEGKNPEEESVAW